MNKTKTLGKSFSKRSLSYSEEIRGTTGKPRLYAQSDNHTPIGFVVAIIETKEAPECWGKDFDQYEAFPSLEDFGTLAWQYGQKEKASALNRFNSLCGGGV